MPNKCLLHDWVNVTLNYCKTSFFVTLETSQPSTKSYLKNHCNINDTDEKKRLWWCWGGSTCLISQLNKKAITSFGVLE